MSGSSNYFTSVLIRILASESVFGYITVLPGAFSAYRYIALQNDSMGEGPLQKYFLGEKMVITISVKGMTLTHVQHSMVLEQIFSLLICTLLKIG